MDELNDLLVRTRDTGENATCREYLRRRSGTEGQALEDERPRDKGRSGLRESPAHWCPNRHSVYQESVLDMPVLHDHRPTAE